MWCGVSGHPWLSTGPNNPVELTAHSVGFGGIPCVFSCGPQLTGSVRQQKINNACTLGAKSRNAYARYERGTSVPTVEKVSELLQAIAPGQDFVLEQSAVG
jgi:hypothetical protein